MKHVLLLEDHPDRRAVFESVVPSLGEGWTLKTWSEAWKMIAECGEFLGSTALISLDHDLVRQPGVLWDPGCGLDVARHLAGLMPICPVIIHSSNTDASWSMHNELRFAGWRAERVGPSGEDWIRTTWLDKARELAGEPSEPMHCRTPNDHRERMQRAMLSLEGLAIGDALGEMLCNRHDQAPGKIASNHLPAGPWLHTDDTEMALSIVDVLGLYGCVHQEALARRFAWRFQNDPYRGYGSMTRRQLQEINAGGSWRQTAAAAFGGQGSMGNGGAMRVAPLGGYFADDLERVVNEARSTCVVTHTHPEGVAGTVAVAVAAAIAWQERHQHDADRPRRFLANVLAHTPASLVRDGLEGAAQLGPHVTPAAAAGVLGNGSLVTAPDTVPFTIWCAARNLDSFSGAMQLTIAAGGDCDTNAAIVGGIVALAAGRDSIPGLWNKHRERFPFEPPVETIK
jgi:ADP-ribosylglycohydrolase